MTMTRTKFEFAQEFGIPVEFPEILKAFAREVLRVQPANVEEFAVKYFERCATNGEDVDDTTQKDDGLSLPEVEGLVRELFVQYDKDQSGYLDLKEFKTLFDDFRERVRMPQDEIYRFLAEADMNEDGNIQYDEFIPIAIQIIQTLFAQKKINAQQDEVDQAAGSYLVHGMSEEEITQVTRDIFQRMDTDKTGTLSKMEFVQALANMELGLTRREINALIFQVDANEDGMISYEEFVPFCFHLLHKMTTMRMLENEMENDELAQFLHDLFQAKDTELCGLIFHEDIKDLLHQAMLGMTRIQIYSVMTEAKINDDGYVAYREFIPKAVIVIKSILSFSNNLETSQKKETFAELQKQIAPVVESLGDPCTVSEFEKAMGQSGLFSEKELKSIIQLAWAGQSKATPRDANTVMDLTNIKAQVLQLVRQLRATAFSLNAAS
eukprot:GEMP01029112.1.p1 GENE.GEMP01029112.1~~GEMP01029112.1.p1  ORF type:complete len:437 (+),score=96.79 GEMP01029112.1:177-1487(+)